MKIVCISDTHNRHVELRLPPGDVLIHAGDYSMRGHVAETEAFLSWFANQPHRQKVFIAGNHDWIFQERRENARAMVPEGVIYLEDEGVTLDGVKIWGSPVTPTFENWAFMHTSATIGTYWDAIPDNTDVLITHGPAYGVLDRVRPHSEHIGCPRLRQVLDTRLRPKLHVFGHIHEDYGQEVDGTLTSVNASFLDHRYLPVNAPVVVTL
ncbi:metallophosphatase domain-containing protein [Deinococcus altitudinis]|uniref:metallophosphatase domain-containing protein n=1 Tax=Deinococcus altitudinis TaxID=468914 RepID=UPI00389285C2